MIVASILLILGGLLMAFGLKAGISVWPFLIITTVGALLAILIDRKADGSSAEVIIADEVLPRKIEISKELTRRMIDLSLVNLPNETGGILIGRREGGSFVVTSIGDAGPDSIATPVSFLRKYEWSRMLLEYEHRKDPSIGYIGEWHSHPVGTISPSLPDVTSLVDLANDPALTVGFVICGIVDVGHGEVGFVAITKHGKVKQLAVCTEEGCSFP